MSDTMKYEINVSKDGRHVFATDGTIREYTDNQIRDLILLFREKFPEIEKYRVSAICRGHKGLLRLLPDFIQAALDGEDVEIRSDKRTKKQNKILEALAEPELLGDD